MVVQSTMRQPNENDYLTIKVALVTPRANIAQVY